MMSCQELSKQENNIYNMIKNKQNKEQNKNKTNCNHGADKK